MLLLNLGTPEQPDTASVRRYLTEFLSDPEVIRLPRRLRFLNWPLARMIAQFRGAKSAALYRNIWTDRGSPLKVITEDQVAALQNAMPKGWQVFYAMRYGTPDVASTLDRIVAADVQELVVIPMYPQFSGPTTGTAVADLYAALRSHGQRLNVSVRNCWYDDVSYIEAQARLIQQFAEQRELDPDDCVLLYSTHSMPESYIRNGDPYREQVSRGVELITRRVGWPEDRTLLSYQSKMGPAKWLTPSTDQTLRDLAEAGEKNVLVCPVSFTADCLETLEEIGIGYRAQFEVSGGRLHLCPALNTFDPFIKALSQLALRGPKPICDCDSTRPPLMRFDKPAAPAKVDLSRLVMIGASLSGRLKSDAGPSVHHVSPEQFQCVKKPHEEVTRLLREIHDTGDFDECWLWNTCNRFEFYGCLKAEPNSSEADQILARTVRQVIGAEADHLPVTVLQGEAVWHHLLRTSAGLNSGLPGDAEVASQLEVARRIATRCETAGPITEKLLQDVLTAQDDMREETSWGRFRPEYCPVAIRAVTRRLDIDWPTAKCVVIGGSATARSILASLTAQFGVPEAQLTAVYRAQSKGEQLKRLRKAVGNGTKLRVGAYDDPRVLEAIADADVVFFAIDRRVPVLHDKQITAARDYTKRPMTVIDFNTFGSTVGLASIDGLLLSDAEQLEAEVAGYSMALCDCPAFTDAAAEAEDWIKGRLKPCKMEAPNGAMTRNGHCHECRGQCDLKPQLYPENNSERTRS